MITCQAENVFGTRVAQVKLIVFGEFVFFFLSFLRCSGCSAK